MNKNAIRLVVFLLWFPALKVQSQGVPYALDSMLSKSLDSMQMAMNIKSLSAAMQFPDTVVWARATGISSTTPLDSVTIDDAYLIGSVTKTMTSACILQLADAGLLNLDDSLYQWLDTVPYINPNITIRQLLRHESGIYDVLGNPACQPALLADQDSVWDAFDLVTTFIAPPQFNPGAAWAYSNTNYFLLGEIIEAATGNTFYDELRTRFFAPLNMTTIATPAHETVTSPVAHVWMDLNNDGITEDAHNFYFNYTSLNSAAGAAGGYYATPSDITRWMRTYMRGDLLSASMMAQAQTTVAAPGLPSTTYGLGLMKKMFVGYQGYGHGGDLAYAASSWYFPARDLSITVFNNDAKFNSWTLVPVISVLLKTYNNYLNSLTGTGETNPEPMSLTVSPNPFSNQLTVSFAAASENRSYKLVLSTIEGKRICEQLHRSDAAPFQQIQLSGLSNISGGLYFLTLFADDVPVKTIKVVH